MSAVWATTWQIIGTGQKTALLGQSAFSSTASVLANSSRRTFLAASFPKSLWVESNASKYRLNIVRDVFNAPKRPWISPPPFNNAQILRVAISNHPASASEFREVSAADIGGIFGGSLDRERGNELLQILQYQRVSGTLDQEISASPFDVERGLNWLRIAIPVDEDAAIIRRLEREDQCDTQNLSRFETRQSAKFDGKYGQSVLEELKEYNERRASQNHVAQEETSKAESSSKHKSKAARPSTAISTRRTRRQEWIQRYWDEAISQHKAAPNMTRLQRLGPSAAVMFAVVGLSIIFAQYYIPPSRKARLWPDLPPAAATVITLIGINFAVFIAWRVFPSRWKFLNTHFLMVPGLPHASSLIGSMFSHQSISHLTVNMVGLWIIGTQLHDEIGRGTFLAVYLSTGVVAGYISLSKYVLQNVFYTSGLGASGAVLGLIGTLCWLHIKWPRPIPWELDQETYYTMLLFFLISADVTGLLIKGSRSRTDHVAHLGGCVAGIVAAEALKYKASLRRQRTMAGKNKIPLTDDLNQSRSEVITPPKS